jgi:ribosomal protein S18 acetylase RimI-like enzyme
VDRDVTVRPTTVADGAYIRDLAKRTAMSSVSAYRSAPPPIVLESLDRLLDIVNGSSHVALIATADGERAGFVLMLDRLPDEVTGMAQGFVAYMAVEPDARGRGLAGALLKAAEDEAKRRGLPYMALMVTEDNEPARTLYERAGYVTERRLLCKRL